MKDDMKEPLFVWGVLLGVSLLVLAAYIVEINGERVKAFAADKWKAAKCFAIDCGESPEGGEK